MHAGSGSRLSGSLRTFCWALLQDGALALEPGPLFARDGDRNRSEQISYRILRGGKRLRGGQTRHLHASFNLLLLLLHPQGTRGISSRSTRRRET